MSHFASLFEMIFTPSLHTRFSAPMLWVFLNQFTHIGIHNAIHGRFPSERASRPKTELPVLFKLDDKTVPNYYSSWA